MHPGIMMCFLFTVKISIDIPYAINYYPDVITETMICTTSVQHMKRHRPQFFAILYYLFADLSNLCNLSSFYLIK